MNSLKPILLIIFLFITQTAHAAFHFMVVGDAPYDDVGRQQFPKLIQKINQDKPEFVLHVGDFKGSHEPCSPTIFKEARSLMNQFESPLIFTPGDNDWTDCHRVGIDPLVALGQVRKIFYPQAGKSLGQKALQVSTESSVPGFAAFVENQMWIHDGVLFGSFHIVGSNNNLGSEAEYEEAAIKEFLSRQKANLVWLDLFFKQAEKTKAKGLVLFFHANPFFETERYYDRSGFYVFFKKLEEHLIQHQIPTLLVHGDSHHFRVDMPFTQSQFIPKRAHQLYHVIRLESFGTPHIHAVKVNVDPSAASLFKIEPFLRD